MHPAAGTNLHGRDPLPTEAAQVPLVCRARYTAAGAGPPALANLLGQGNGVDRVVDLLVGLLSGDGNCSDHALATPALISGCRPPAVVVSEIHCANLHHVLCNSDFL